MADFRWLSALQWFVIGACFALNAVALWDHAAEKRYRQKMLVIFKEHQERDARLQAIANALYCKDSSAKCEEASDG